MLRVSRSLLGASLLFSLCGCSILPWGGTFDLDLQGGDLSTVEYVFVIVDAQEKIADTQDDALPDLLDSSKLEKYVAFVQLEPVDADGWSWKELSHDSALDLVGVDVDDSPTVHIEIERRDLLELHDKATLVLLASYDDQTWKFKPLTAGELESLDAMTLRVGPEGFTVIQSK